MDQARYSFRGAHGGDCDARSRISSRLNPEFPITSEELRQWDRIFQGPRLVKLDVVVEERASGNCAAYGYLHHVPDMYDAHRFWVGVEVDPDYQHRGIGRALYERL